MRLNKLLILTTLLAALTTLTAPKAAAQTVGIKTNLLNDAALSPNLAVEVGVAPRWTVELYGEMNLWKVHDTSMKRMYLQPAAKYWLCQRFAGHFFGVHAIGGTYNFGNLDFSLNFLGTDFRKFKDNRYQGWGVGAGISYGYAWPVHKHWNVEAEVGIGWIYTRYDQYPCEVCGTKIASDKPHNYFGPTKLAVSLVYLF